MLTPTYLEMGNPDGRTLPSFKYEACSKTSSIPAAQLVAVACLWEKTDAICTVESLRRRTWGVKTK